MVKNRNIALAILFSIITCGIYFIYWQIMINNDMNYLTPEDSFQTSGGIVFLLSLITCGIYAWYWAYRMGCKMDLMKNGESHAILFILLQIFGLGIVNNCIMQSAINDCAEI